MSILHASLGRKVCAYSDIANCYVRVFVCAQFEKLEMNQYRLLVQSLEQELEDFDLCCPENFR